jgi:hypothetical protein
MATYMDAVNGNHTSQPNYDIRHGSPYDRGSADSYYGRRFNPHYYLGATGSSPLVEMKDMTAAEITAYTAGFRDNEELGDKKNWK